MEIKASVVKALREKTGAGMMECKNALNDSQGDIAAAEKLLKEKGLAAVEKRAGRATTEGILVVKSDGKKAIMAELTCETDFVAKNADFVALGNSIVDTAWKNGFTAVTPVLSEMVLELATKIRENMSVSRLVAVNAGADELVANYIHFDKKTGVLIVLKADKIDALKNPVIQEFAYDCCLHVAAFTPLYSDSSAVDKQYIADQTDIFTKQVAELDKPENVKAGIVQGKIKKHLAEICFLEQPFVKDEKLSVSRKMEEIGKIAGCKLSLSNMILFQLGNK